MTGWSSLGIEQHNAPIALLIAKCEAANLTQTALAKSLGAHQSLIAGIDSGQRRIFVVEFLKLAEALEFDPAQAPRDIKTPAKRRCESEWEGASRRLRLFVRAVDFAIACRQLHKIDHCAKPQQTLQVVKRGHGAGVFIFRDARTGLARRTIGADPVIERAIISARGCEAIVTVYVAALAGHWTGARNNRSRRRGRGSVCLAPGP